MMKKMTRILFLQIVLATKLMVFCDERKIDILSTRNDTGAGTSQMLYNPKAHIDKFIDSWRYYAKANDIAKREKLKMALRDALHSIEKPQKHSNINDVDINSIKRIKEAAVLLKEFKEMESLSDAVKRTLGEYKQAKKKLLPNETATGESLLADIQIDKIKKDYIENKRDIIPSHKSEKSYIDGAVDSDWLPAGKVHLTKPVVIKRTNKILVKANPINGGEVGLEYSSIDPRYSNVEQAEKAMRAAVVILKYSDANKKYEESEERKLDDGKIREHTVTKTVIPGSEQTATKPAVANILESLVNSDGDLPAEDKAAIESLDKETRFQASNLIKSGRGNTNVKKEIVNKYVGQLKQLYSRYLKIKGENDTVENALQFQNEIINSNLGNVSRDLMDDDSSTTGGGSKSSLNDDGKDKADLKGDTKDDDKYLSMGKQDDTVKELKEARLAKVKYELAKHELAHKIKELYVLANNYEKDETENQILEVKNLISHTPNKNKGEVIPGSHSSEKSSIETIKKPTPEYENTSNIIGARDDVHPGMALAGIPEHKVEKNSLLQESEGVHEEFTMGAKDKSAHQMELPTPIISKFTKNADKSDYDYLHLPSDNETKREEKKEDGEKEKNNDETLNIIAQAIKEDMKEISKTKEEGEKEVANSLLSSDKKPSNVTENHVAKLIAPKENDSEKPKHNDTNDTADAKQGLNSANAKQEHASASTKQDLASANTKQGLTYNNESVDDYLTKALSDIISQDSLNTDQSPSLADTTLSPDNTESKDDDASERNKQVVEKAMRQHAKNPNLPLPLVDTKGDKIKLNPALNESLNDNDTDINAANDKPKGQPDEGKPADATPDNDKQPASAVKEGKSPAEIPTDVLLKATDKNTSTSLPDIDLHDPENKLLLEKASHMEESIAAAQDKLYSEMDSKTSEADIDGHKDASMTDNSMKTVVKTPKEDASSRDTLGTKPITEHQSSSVTISPSVMEEENDQMRAAFRHQGDPYSSIQEHPSLSRSVDIADMDVDDGMKRADIPHTPINQSHMERPKRSMPNIPLPLLPPLQLSEDDPNAQTKFDALQNHALLYQDSLAFVNPYHDKYTQLLGSQTPKTMSSLQRSFVNHNKHWLNNVGTYDNPRPFVGISRGPTFNSYDSPSEGTADKRFQTAFPKVERKHHHHHRHHHHNRRRYVQNPNYYNQPYRGYQQNMQHRTFEMNPPYPRNFIGDRQVSYMDMPPTPFITPQRSYTSEPQRPYMNDPQRSYMNGPRYTEIDDPRQPFIQNTQRQWNEPQRSFINEQPRIERHPYSPFDVRQNLYRSNAYNGRPELFYPPRYYGQPSYESVQNNRREFPDDNSRERSFMDSPHYEEDRESPDTMYGRDDYFNTQQFGSQSPNRAEPQSWSQIPFLAPESNSRPDNNVADFNNRDEDKSGHHTRNEIENTDHFPDQSINTRVSLNQFAETLAKQIEEENKRRKMSKHRGYGYGFHAPYDDEEPPEPPEAVHHRRHHRHQRHHRHHRRRHRLDDDVEPERERDEDGVGQDTADDEEDENLDAPDDEEDDDEDEEDDRANDKKSNIKYFDPPDKRSFNSTAFIPENDTVSMGGNKLTDDVIDNVGSIEPDHIEELEDSKRSGIPEFGSLAWIDKENSKNVKKEQIKPKVQFMDFFRPKYLEPNIEIAKVMINKKSDVVHQTDKVEDQKRSTIPIHKKKKRRVAKQKKTKKSLLKKKQKRS